MLFRIGINLGDVMVEDDNLFGVGVNIAARLQALAAPGGICISDSVYQQIRNKVPLGYKPLGKHSVMRVDRAGDLRPTAQFIPQHQREDPGINHARLLT